MNDDAVLIEIANLQNYQVYLLIQGYLYPMYVLFVQCLFLKAPQHHYTLIATHWPGTNLDNLVENVVYIHLIVLSEGRDLMCMLLCGLTDRLWILLNASSHSYVRPDIEFVHVCYMSD